MGERIFVRQTTAWQAMPREENGKARASGPLSSTQARSKTKSKLDDAKAIVTKSESHCRPRPTHEIGRPAPGSVSPARCREQKMPAVGRAKAESLAPQAANNTLQHRHVQTITLTLT
jgi:hypothetical protein